MSMSVDSILTELAVGQLWQAPAEARCTSRSIVKIVEVEGIKLIAFRRREGSSRRAVQRLRMAVSESRFLMPARPAR